MTPKDGRIVINDSSRNNEININLNEHFFCQTISCVKIIIVLLTNLRETDYYKCCLESKRIIEKILKNFWKYSVVLTVILYQTILDAVLYFYISQY